MNFRKPKASRLRLAPLLAVAGLLVVVASASAVVYVYKNGFKAKSSYKEIDQAGGGNACDKDYLEDSSAMRIEVSGKEFCEYAPPVSGDRDQPDHEILIQGRISKDTPKDVRERSYLAVRVRVGNGDYYEFRVFPKTRAYKLNREPDNPPDFPDSGQSDEINKVGENNTLRLRATGNKISAFVNGKLVAPPVMDNNMGQVEGRKVSFGIGSTKGANNGPIGAIKRVKVGIPNP